MEKTGRVVGDVDSRGKPRVQTSNFGKSKTVQSDAHLTDIATILKRYEKTGVIDHLAGVEARYMDVSEFTDYKDLMDHVRGAEMEFMKLPAVIRAGFDHDVAKWLDAAHDKDGSDGQEIQAEVDVKAAAVQSISDSVDAGSETDA